MELIFQTFWIQKEGNEEKEYEDAYYAPKRVVLDKDQKILFAVADGATESVFSNIWANILVKAYVRGQLSPLSFGDDIPPLQEKWNYILGKMELPWHAIEKLKQGTHSSLLGLKIFFSFEHPNWGLCEALALGDSCLFQVRGNQVIKSHPISKSTEFNDTPSLVSTSKAHNNLFIERRRITKKLWRKSDYFYLMTDAMALWFMHQNEMGNNPHMLLQELMYSDRKHFIEFITELRQKRLIKNDDVTLICIHMR